MAELLKVALDTETTGVLPWNGDAPFAFSLCTDDGNSCCWQWPVDPFTRRVHPAPQDLRYLQDICGDPHILKIFHNAKFDMRMLECSFGIRTVFPIADTMIMARVVNSIEEDVGLKPLASRYCNFPDTDQAELQAAVVAARKVGRKKGWKLAEDVQADYWTLQQTGQSELLERYACADAERTMLLWFLFQQALEADPNRYQIYYEHEMKLFPIVYRMETRGIRYDPVVGMAEREKLQDRREKFRRELRQMTGNPDFNPNSATQVAEFMERSGLTIEKRTKTGKPSVDVKTLAQYQEHPFVQLELGFRAADKGLSSFFDRYEQLRVPDPLVPGGWALHPSFNQSKARTGRFSCSDPNFQNVANALTTRSVEPIQARTPFGPRPGYAWVFMDYSQLEVRIFADVAHETTMLAAIEANRDLHTECANKVWGGRANPAAIRAAAHALELHHRVPQDEASAEAVLAAWERLGWNPNGNHSPDVIATVANTWLEEFDYDIVRAEASLGKKTSRAKAKMGLFTKLYGGGVPAVMDLVGCSQLEASQFLDDYDLAFPTIKAYIRQLSSQAAADGEIVNRYGRRIKVLPDKAYRAVNYMVQGSAADLLKRSMIRCDELLAESGLDAHMVLTIHDELVFEVREDHLDTNWLTALKWTMEDHEGHFNVPLPVDVKISRGSWIDKEKLEL